MVKMGRDKNTAGQLLALLLITVNEPQMLSGEEEIQFGFTACG